MIKNIKENNRIWIDYPQIHNDAKKLAIDINKKTPGSLILIAVGRGGWIPTRILSSCLDAMNIINISYSVNSSYRKLGSKEEFTEIVQGLDDESISNICRLEKKGYSIWVIEGISHTGRAIESVRDYINTEMNKIEELDKKIYTAALHMSKYSHCKDYPWRMNIAIRPDAYGSMIKSDEKPHIEYPWEYGEYKIFKLAMERNGDEK